MILSHYTNGTDERKQKQLRLLELVAKYSSSYPKMESATTMNGNHLLSGAVVLLTGSTGSFGSNILAKLIASPEVARIYALSRASPEGVEERHLSAFSREGLDTELLKSGKVLFLYGDPSYEDFKMNSIIYSEVSYYLRFIRQSY